MAGCSHDHVLAFCDQQVIVRLRPHGQFYEYVETLVNDQVVPEALRTVCETCGIQIDATTVRTQSWLNQQNRKRWLWNLMSNFEHQSTIRNLRKIIEELSDGDR